MVGENIYRNNREFKNTAVNYTGEKFIIRCGNCLETNEAMVVENKGNTLMGFKCPYCNGNYNLADITLMNNKESLIKSGETTIDEHRNNVILVGYTFKQYSPNGDTIKLNEYKSTLKFECKLGKLRKSPLMDINKGGKLSTSHYGSYCPTVDWEENEYPNLSHPNFLKLGNIIEENLKQLGYKDIISFNEYIKPIDTRDCSKEILYRILNAYNLNPFVDYYYTRLVHMCKQHQHTKLYNKAVKTKITRNPQIKEKALELESILTYNNERLANILKLLLAEKNPVLSYSLEMLLSFSNLVQSTLKHEESKEYIYSLADKLGGDLYDYIGYILNQFQSELFLDLIFSCPRRVNSELILLKSIIESRVDLSLITKCVEMYEVLKGHKNLNLNINDMDWNSLYQLLAEEHSKLYTNVEYSFKYNNSTYQLCDVVGNYKFELIGGYRDLQEISKDLDDDLTELLGKVLSGKLLLISVKDLISNKFVNLIKLLPQYGSILDIYGDNLAEIKEWQTKNKLNVACMETIELFKQYKIDLIKE